MAEPKTKLNDASVEDFLNKTEGDQKREDCIAISRMMQQVTKAPPKMWGGSIVGFGAYRYKYASGQEGNWPLTGFSPRKQNITIYITSGFERYDELMKKLGKFSIGKSCLYIKRLADIDTAVLKELVTQSVAHMKATNLPATTDAGAKAKKVKMPTTK